MVPKKGLSGNTTPGLNSAVFLSFEKGTVLI